MFLKCLLLLFVLSFVEAEFSYHRASPTSCTIPRIKSGRVRPRQRGTFLKFACSMRYTLVGNKYATCRYGQWDVPPPVCVKSGCQPLEEVKNAVNMTYHGNAWVVFFCFPGYQLAGSPVVYCDGTNWNATVPGCYDSLVKYSTNCDFEQPDICGWKADELHDFDWRRLNKKTPSSFLQTGPSYDHTYGKNGSGYYMYIESTGRIVNDTARLISPVYDAELAKNGCFIFYYHMFGRSMGGLRVYQKPDGITMYGLLSGPLRKNYTLFEQWGDQGNEWYSSVSMLSDFSDNFQIVIEGIRGDSFMSDIAIDDVSIQHGENCTKAMVQATTPPTVLQESCVGRCDPFAEAVAGYRGCSCSIVCVVTQNCCPDFLDVCDTDNKISSSTEDYIDANSSVETPQTQKLVATTSETLPPTTSTTITTTTSTSTATTTTTRPVRLDSTTTTKAPTTSTSTTTTTTTKPPPRPTTITTTTAKPTTKKTTPSTTTIATKPIITRKSTTLSVEVSPISSTNIFFVQTTKHEDEIKTKDIREKGKQEKVVQKKTEGMSGATIAMTVVLVGVAFVGALWAAYIMTRTTRGVAALARIRGRTSSDPEVHYLKNDFDEE